MIYLLWARLFKIFKFQRNFQLSLKFHGKKMVVKQRWLPDSMLVSNSIKSSSYLLLYVSVEVGIVSLLVTSGTKRLERNI